MSKKVVSVVFAIILMMALAGCTVYGGHKNKGWTATGGEALERQFWSDVKAKNLAELEKHMATTWVFLTPSGPLDRAATLEHIRQMDIGDYMLGDFKVTPNGSDMVVTYTAQVRGTQLKMMTVWQQAPKGWIAIAHADAR